MNDGSGTRIPFAFPGVEINFTKAGDCAESPAPLDVNTRLDRLQSRIADVISTAAKARRWGLDSVDPVAGSTFYGQTNRFILVSQFRLVRQAMADLEDDFADKFTDFPVERFRDVTGSLGIVRNDLGLEAVLDVLQGFGVTKAIDLASIPTMWQAVQDACDRKLGIPTDGEAATLAAGLGTRNKYALNFSMPGGPVFRVNDARFDKYDDAMAFVKMHFPDEVDAAAQVFGAAAVEWGKSPGKKDPPAAVDAAWGVILSIKSARLQTALLRRFGVGRPAQLKPNQVEEFVYACDCIRRALGLPAMKMVDTDDELI